MCPLTPAGGAAAGTHAKPQTVISIVITLNGSSISNNKTPPDHPPSSYASSLYYAYRACVVADGRVVAEIVPVKWHREMFTHVLEGPDDMTGHVKVHTDRMKSPM